MKRVFADTFYYLSLLSRDDEAHAAAAQFTADFDGMMLTTDWVLLELADALAGSNARSVVIEFVDALRHDPAVRIIPANRKFLDRAWQLYRRRADKAWSLTDCTSFILMRQQRINEALTADRHFAQAGFKVLL